MFALRATSPDGKHRGRVGSVAETSTKFSLDVTPIVGRRCGSTLEVWQMKRSKDQRLISLRLRRNTDNQFRIGRNFLFR